jgi:hypothetical protein
MSNGIEISFPNSAKVLLPCMFSMEGVEYLVVRYIKYLDVTVGRACTTTGIMQLNKFFKQMAATWIC